MVLVSIEVFLVFLNGLLTHYIYRVAANFCNPPGILQYFRGPQGPQWGDCPGEGEARGGYRPWGNCGGSVFPEEYYTCADITIKRTPARIAEQEPHSVTEKTPSPSPIPLGDNPVKALRIFLDGNKHRDVKDKGRAYIRLRNRDLALEAFTGSDSPKAVYFSVPGRRLWKETTKPYVLGGNQGTTYEPWENPVKDKWITISITVEDAAGRRHWFNCELFIA